MPVKEIKQYYKLLGGVDEKVRILCCVKGLLSINTMSIYMSILWKAFRDREWGGGKKAWVAGQNR